MNDHQEDESSNPSGNRPFDEVIQARLSRRGALAGGAASMVAVMLGTSGAASAQEAVKSDDSDGDDDCDFGHDYDDGRIEFRSVPNADAVGPEPTISEDYEYGVLIPWGTPLQPDGPEFSWPQTKASDQENQIGIGHDGMWFFQEQDDRGMLCLNHEFGRTTHVLGKELPESEEDVRIMQAAHGISVVKIQRRRDTWQPVASGKNRRITVNTPIRFSGPVTNGSRPKPSRCCMPTATGSTCVARCVMVPGSLAMGRTG